jgi:rhodanese-related sulfurtransferase
VEDDVTAALSSVVRWLGGVCALALLSWSGSTWSQTARVLVVLDTADAESGLLMLGVADAPLQRMIGSPVSVLPQRNLHDALRATRTQENDIIIGPPHVIASALAYGYELIAATGSTARFVLVGGSGLKTVADLKGRRAYLPSQDSMRSYMARGLMAQEGFSPRGLKEARYAETSGAGIVSVNSGQADVTVALEQEWNEWAANAKSSKVLATSQPVPWGLGAVARREASAALRRAVLDWTARDNFIPGFNRLRPTSDAAPYEYVASLGIFTPAELNGVTRVSARQAFDLAAKGAKLVDVRTEKEFNTRHARGAVLAPYEERSTKEPDFDVARDKFAGLAKFSKNEPLIFLCNGAECWKSFKAAKVARDNGYTQVYWLRGGMPEWTQQKLPTSP